MEQEIDLRPVFGILARRWKLLVGMALIVAFLFALAVLVRPTGRQASADLLLLGTSAQLTLDPRFTTRDASQVTNQLNQRQAVVNLATSPGLESRVAQRLGVSMAQPGELRSRIRLDATSDLMRITASAPTQAEALALAEAWAREFELLVDEVFTGGQAITRLETELGEAQQRYDEAQQSLESYLGDGRLVQAQQDARRLDNLLADTLEAQSLLYSDYLTRTRELNLILEDARAVRELVVTGEAANLGDTLASLALRARVAGGAELPVELRFDTLEAFAESGNALAQIEQLEAVLEQEQARLAAQAEEIGQAIATGDSSTVGLDPATRARYEADLADALRNLQRERAQEELLTQRRQIALDSIKVLQTKIDELIIAQGSPQVAVRYISASQAAPQSLVVRATIAGVAGLLGGLLLGLITVLILERRKLVQALPAAPAQAERSVDQPAPLR